MAQWILIKTNIFTKKTAITYVRNVYLQLIKKKNELKINYVDAEYYDGGIKYVTTM